MNTLHEAAGTNVGEKNPEAKAESGRHTGSGQFQKGNRGEPGNPFARQTAKLRQAALDAVSDEDMRDIMNALKEKAKRGDVAATKLLLSYAIGKPGAAAEPDMLDQQEFKTMIDSHVASPEELLKVVQGMPIDALLFMFRAMLPALYDSKMKLAAEVLLAPEPEPEDDDAVDEELGMDAERAAANIPEWMHEVVEKNKAVAGHSDGQRRYDFARQADPLTPNPSPPSTGARGAEHDDPITPCPAPPSMGARGAEFDVPLAACPSAPSTGARGERARSANESEQVAGIQMQLENMIEQLKRKCEEGNGTKAGAECAEDLLRILGGRMGEGMLGPIANGKNGVL